MCLLETFKEEARKIAETDNSHAMKHCIFVNLLLEAEDDLNKTELSEFVAYSESIGL